MFFQPPPSSRSISHGLLGLHTPPSRFHRRRGINRRTSSSTARARRVCRKMPADPMGPLSDPHLWENRHSFLRKTLNCMQCAYRSSYRLPTPYRLLEGKPPDSFLEEAHLRTTSRASNTSSVRCPGL